MKFHETQLANGLKIIGEVNPAAQSVAVGFFVRTGSRDETKEVSGVSHFLEHMAFKGDEKYSADDVNRIFDELGASYNASTSEEITLFYAAVLPEYLSQVFELLTCLIYPSLREEDFNMEKNVILEEIGMYDDQPGFLAYEKCMETHFSGHPLSQSILGSVESISNLSVDQMRKYHADQYQAGNIVLALAGNMDWSDVLSMSHSYCEQWPAGESDRPIDQADPQGGLSVITRNSSVQQHVMQMAKAPSAQHHFRYAANLLSVIVGDDSGSRLFWDIVDPGYAEAAELGYNEYDGSGTYLTYLSCTPEDTVKNLERIREIYASVNQTGITQQELEEAKHKVASRIVLRSERPMGRLSSLGNNWVYGQQYRSVEEDLNTVQRLTTNDIGLLLDAYPLGQVTTVGVGPKDHL